MDQVEFNHIFERLKNLFETAKGDAVALEDSPKSYMLNTPYSKKYGKEVYLGGVRIQKNYVSFYLMPVYIYPDLLVGVSPQLLKHMQGKSCFNFKAVDESLFSELSALAQDGIEQFRKDGLL
jgi:hypothetical protein